MPSLAISAWLRVWPQHALLLPFCHFGQNHSRIQFYSAHGCGIHTHTDTHVHTSTYSSAAKRGDFNKNVNFFSCLRGSWRWEKANKKVLLVMNLAAVFVADTRSIPNAIRPTWPTQSQSQYTYTYTHIHMVHATANENIIWPG